MVSTEVFTELVGLKSSGSRGWKQRSLEPEPSVCVGEPSPMLDGGILGDVSVCFLGGVVAVVTVLFVLRFCPRVRLVRLPLLTGTGFRAEALLLGRILSGVTVVIDLLLSGLCTSLCGPAKCGVHGGWEKLEVKSLAAALAPHCDSTFPVRWNVSVGTGGKGLALDFTASTSKVKAARSREVSSTLSRLAGSVFLNGRSL